MLNYVNNVLTSCKAQIHNQGLDVHFDENGQPVNNIFNIINLKLFID